MWQHNDFPHRTAPLQPKNNRELQGIFRVLNPRGCVIALVKNRNLCFPPSAPWSSLRCQIYHQLDHRIEAHIFVAFVAYYLQVSSSNACAPWRPA